MNSSRGNDGSDASRHTGNYSTIFAGDWGSHKRLGRGSGMKLPQDSSGRRNIHIMLPITPRVHYLNSLPNRYFMVYSAPPRCPDGRTRDDFSAASAKMDPRSFLDRGVPGNCRSLFLQPNCFSNPTRRYLRWPGNVIARSTCVVLSSFSGSPGGRWSRRQPKRRKGAPTSRRLCRRCRPPGASASCWAPIGLNSSPNWRPAAN